MMRLLKHEVFRPQRTMFGVYSAFVCFCKWGLITLIVLIVVFMIGIPLVTMDRAGENLLEMNAPEEVATPEKSAPTMMEHPKFQGVDSEGRPYLVTADSAIQSSEHTVILNQVQADLTMDDGAWITLLADQGLMDNQEQSLLLQGDVQIYHNAGHEMHTQEVRIDMRTHRAQGTNPVHMQGPMGRIDADEFIVIQKEQRIIFNHHVSVELLP